MPYVNPNDGYVLSNVRCNSVFVKDTYEYEYLSELTYLEDLPYVSPRTHQFNSTKKGSKFDFDTLFTKLEYKVKYEEYEKDKILEFNVSSATVELAAQALNCEASRIAKTLSFIVNDMPILVVCAGDVKVKSNKFKDYFTKSLS